MANDHTYYDPTVVAVGKPVTGTIMSWEADYFHVDLEAGKTYIIKLLGAAAGGGTLTADAKLDISFSWNTGDNAEVATAGGAGNLPVMAVTPNESGRYRFAIGASAANVNSTYTVLVSEASTVDDYGSTRVSAGSAAVGSLAAGRIEQVGDTDAFRLTLEQGVLYDFKAKPGAAAGLDLSLNNYFGFLQRTGDAAAGFTFLAQETDHYLYAHGASATGDYVISVNKAVDDFTANAATTGVLVAVRRPVAASTWQTTWTGSHWPWCRARLTNSPSLAQQGRSSIPAWPLLGIATSQAMTRNWSSCQRAR